MSYASRSRMVDQARRNGREAAPGSAPSPQLERRPGNGVTNFRFEKKPRQKTPPPLETHAESFYYLKQMDARTPMVIVLGDGEKVRGRIEWYDRDCLKINRADGPNLLIPKASIKYLFKADEER